MRVKKVEYLKPNWVGLQIGDENIEFWGNENNTPEQMSQLLDEIAASFDESGVEVSVYMSVEDYTRMRQHYPDQLIEIHD